VSSNSNNNRRWYIVHTYSGYEERVRKSLEQIRGGQRRTVTKKIFPGYVLVEMKMDDDSWQVVRNTPGVTGFVGGGNKPTPLAEDEVKIILRQMQDGSPQVKVGFRKGESVRVVDGPFTDFIGTVDEINMGKGKVKILLSLFGRETSVELDFLQVERL
jgi:transcriptional antiterminator NusG